MAICYTYHRSAIYTATITSCSISKHPQIHPKIHYKWHIFYCRHLQLNSEPNDNHVKNDTVVVLVITVIVFTKHISIQSYIQTNIGFESVVNNNVNSNRLHIVPPNMTVCYQSNVQVIMYMTRNVMHTVFRLRPRPSKYSPTVSSIETKRSLIVCCIYSEM